MADMIAYSHCPMRRGGFFLRFFRQTATLCPSPEQDLLDELEHTKILLKNARLSFNSQSDPQLIEASIYEINAISARYNYLLRRAKAIEN